MAQIFDAVDPKTAIADVSTEPKQKSISLKSFNPSMYRVVVHDSKMHDANFAFLTTQLAKLHTKLVEPKYYITYRSDIDVNYGGGLVDYVQYYSVNWAGISEQIRNAVGNGANYIPRVNAGMNQYNAVVYTYQIAYDIRFVELEKMKKLTLQKSLESIYKDAIVASWDFYCQKVAYTGGDAQHKGLFNHDDIVPVNQTEFKKSEIVDGTLSNSSVIGIINGIIQSCLTASNMNLSVLPDTFLVPTWFASALTNRTSELLTENVYSYLLKHNLANAISGDNYKISIKMRPDLDNAGVNGTGRIVAYKKDEAFVRLDIPYPIQSFITLPNIDKMAYTTAFLGQVSEIQLPYCTSNTDKASPVQYWDFAAED